VLVTIMSGRERYALIKMPNSSGSSVGRIEVKASGVLYVRADSAGTRFTVGRRFRSEADIA